MDHLKCLAGAFSIIFKKEGNDLKFRKCFTAILCAIVVLSVSGCGVPSQSVAEAPASTVPDERTNESTANENHSASHAGIAKVNSILACINLRLSGISRNRYRLLSILQTIQCVRQCLRRISYWGWI